MDKPEIIENKQLKVSEVNGKTVIVFDKAKLRGKVTSTDVMNVILIAARMQAEKYVEKLQRAPLDIKEVQALKQLAEIVKENVELPETIKKEEIMDVNTSNTLKSTLYAALSERLDKK